MQRAFVFVVAALTACASATNSADGGHPPADMDHPHDLEPAPRDATSLDDFATPPDLIAAIPALVDVQPQETTIAVGKTFPLAAVFAGKYFGQQPITVDFMSSDSTIAAVPATAQLMFNNDQATLLGGAVKVGDVTITASQGGVSKTATVHVVPSLSDIEPMPLKVQVGQTATLTVTLASPALTGGADVALQSGDTTVATVPATVNIPQGMTSTTVMVSGVAIGPTAITASYAGSMVSTQVMSIDPVTRLVVSEVLYDAVGTDDGWEWIELFNGSSATVALSGYFLASTASSSATTYTAVTPALSGMLAPGGCIVVGGPMASPSNNGLPASFTFAPALKFNPNLPNGTLVTAEGVALYQGVPTNVAGATMTDAVIYGTMQRGIVDETGGTMRLDVGYVKFPGQTIERFGPTEWRVQNTPTGGACDWLHL